jgi:hypothetical protein
VREQFESLTGEERDGARRLRWFLSGLAVVALILVLVSILRG